MRIKNNKTLIYFLAITGIIAVIFYFSHVIAGRLVWVDYNPYSQPISDLSSVGSVSQAVTQKILYGYNFFNLLFCLFLLVFFKKHKQINNIFYAGLVLMLISELLSTFGYLLFPLDNAEWANTFQNMMHYIITAVIVFSYILLSILLTVGLKKEKNHKKMSLFLLVFTIIFIASGLGTVLAAEIIPSFVGLVERINLYSLMMLKVILAVWVISLNIKNKEKEILLDDKRSC